MHGRKFELKVKKEFEKYECTVIENYGSATTKYLPDFNIKNFKEHKDFSVECKSYATRFSYSRWLESPQGKHCNSLPETGYLLWQDLSEEKVMYRGFKYCKITKYASYTCSSPNFYDVIEWIMEQQKLPEAHYFR